MPKWWGADMQENSSTARRVPWVALVLLVAALLLGVLVTVVLWRQFSRPGSELDGTWQTVRVEIEDGTSGNDLPTVRLTILGDKLSCTGIGNIDGSITTDATQSPKAFDGRGSSKDGAKLDWSGIYEIEGDTLKLCIGEPGARPKEFKSNPATLWVLKRVK